MPVVSPSSPLLPPISYVYTLIRSYWAFSRLNNSKHFSPLSPDPSTSSQPFIGLPPVCPCLSCTEDPRLGSSTIDVVSMMLCRGDGSSFSVCWKHASSCSLRCCWPPLPQGTLLAHVQLCPPGPTSPPLQSWFSVAPQRVLKGARLFISF